MDESWCFIIAIAFLTGCTADIIGQVISDPSLNITIEKHLDDPFYQEGTTSISLRDHIFRELVANIIAHREYTSSAPATIVIYEDRVEFKNPNVPHGSGPIDPLHFTPYPKNPTICKFMIQMGRYDELGSGINKVTKYLPF